MRRKYHFLLILLCFCLAMVVAACGTQTNASDNKPSTQIPSPAASPTLQSTATANPNRPVHEGQIIYSTPQSSSDYDAFAWSSDSQRVAASTNGQVQIWDATTGQHRVVFTPSGHGSFSPSLSWSPNGRYLAVGSRVVQIINPTTGSVVRTFTNPVAFSDSGLSRSPYLADLHLLSGGPISSLTAWSPDGRLMATIFGNVVVIWNPSTGAVVYRFQNVGPVFSMSWSADSQDIASVNATSSLNFTTQVQVWNAHTGQIILTQGNISDPSIAWAPSGMTLAFFVNNGTKAPNGATVEVWDVATNKEVASYKAPANQVLAWSPDGKEIASGSGTDVVVWDANTGDLLSTFTSQGGFVLSLVWSPDGKYIVSGSSSIGGHSYARVWIA